MRERKGVDPAWIHALFFCSRYRKDGDSNMAHQSPHTSIYYGSTKPATDVKIENIIHYLCDSGPGYCKRCPSQCAYGKRFLQEFAGDIRVKDETIGDSAKRKRNNLCLRNL